MPDTGAVPFAFVPSGKANYRKALLVSSLQDLRATLDQYGVQRNNVDFPAPERRRPEHMAAGNLKSETEPNLRIRTHHQIRNDQLTNDGNGGREQLAPAL